jgi:hypothetical protein
LTRAALSHLALVLAHVVVDGLLLGFARFVFGGLAIGPRLTLRVGAFSRSRRVVRSFRIHRHDRLLDAPVRVGTRRREARNAFARA